jgi:hypothetical protein
MGAMAFEDNVFFKALGLPLLTRSTSTFLDWQRDVQRRAPKVVAGTRIVMTCKIRFILLSCCP